LCHAGYDLTINPSPGGLDLPLRPLVGSDPLQDRDGTGVPVHPDDVAGVKALHRISGSHDTGNAEFAGHDRGVPSLRLLYHRRLQPDDRRVAGSGRLAEIGAVPSIGTVVGDSFDNALSETVNGSYKTELIYDPARPGPWKTIEDVELAILSHRLVVDWIRHRVIGAARAM
jgi:hypothetical protein